MWEDQVCLGHHETLTLVDTRIVRGVKGRGLLHTLSQEVLPRPLTASTLDVLLRVEGTGTSVQEMVEASPLSFLLVQKNSEKLLFSTKTLIVQLKSQIEQDPAL